jgi:phospholipid/cholesterol/gamma-HCH transport system substrate-binding protein
VLIEVVMSLRSSFAERMLKDPDLRAQLQLSGITGLRYVEIDRHKGDALLKSPELSFKPPYPLIPSTPSQFKAVTEALQDIYNKVINVDLAGISSDMRATLQAADQVLRDERLQQTLTNMGDHRWPSASAQPRRPPERATPAGRQRFRQATNQARA